MRRNRYWWENVPLTVGDFTEAQLREECERAQQVGEDLAVAWAEWMADNLGCPVCGRRMADHTRRERRRCDNSRPDLQLVS